MEFTMDRFFLPRLHFLNSVSVENRVCQRGEAKVRKLMQALLCANGQRTGGSGPPPPVPRRHTHTHPKQALFGYNSKHRDFCSAAGPQLQRRPSAPSRPSQNSLTL